MKFCEICSKCLNLIGPHIGEDMEIVLSSCGCGFRKMFGKLPDVVIPEMYSELTSRRVLVMEWVEVHFLSHSIVLE